MASELKSHLRGLFVEVFWPRMALSRSTRLEGAGWDEAEKAKDLLCITEACFVSAAPSACGTADVLFTIRSLGAPGRCECASLD